MRGRRVFQHTDFRGGVDVETSPYLLDGNASPDMLNVMPRGNGIRVRNGFNALTAAQTGTISSFGIADLPTADSTALLFTSDNGIRSVNLSTGATASRIGAMANTAPGTWCSLTAPTSGGQGPFFAMNGTDAPIYWTGAVGTNVAAWTASGGTLQNGRYCIYHGNRVWVAGVPGSPTTLYWSSLTATGGGDPRNWDSTAPNDAGSVTLDSDDGMPITGLAKVGPYLIVFKERRAYLIYDLNTGANRRLSDQIGCIAHRTIGSTPQGTFFLSSEGFMVTDGQTIKPIGRAVRPYLDTQVTAGAAIVWERAYMCGLYNGNQTLGYIFRYEIDLGTWWLWQLPGGALPSQWGIGRSQVSSIAPAVPKLFVADNTLGTVNPKKLFVYGYPQGTLFDDNGAGVSASWTSPFHPLGNGQVNKVVKEIRLDADGTVSLEVARFPTDSLAAKTAINWEAAVAGDVNQRRFYTPGHGRLFQVRFSALASAETRVMGYEFAYDTRRD